MPTTSMTEKAYLYCNTLISMLRESDTNSNRYDFIGYSPRFDFNTDSGAYFREAKKQDAPEEETIEVVQPKKQTKKQVGLMEELADLKEEGERIFNYLKTEMDKDKDISEIKKEYSAEISRLDYIKKRISEIENKLN